MVGPTGSWALVSQPTNKRRNCSDIYTSVHDVTAFKKDCDLSLRISI